MTATTGKRATVAEELSCAIAVRELVVSHFNLARTAVSMAVESALAPSFLAPFENLRRAQQTAAPALSISVAALRCGDAGRLGLDDVSESGAITSSDDGNEIVHVQRNSIAALDRSEGTIHMLARPSAATASWQRAKPLQALLSVFFADRGVDLVHAGIVSSGGAGVLLAGRGGSGKSTVTLASALAGLDILGDDCVALRVTDGAATGYSLFGSVCIEPDHLRSFTRVDARLGGDKAVVTAPGMVSEASIRAVVLPRVTRGAAVTVRPASARDALLALAPSSILKRAVPASAALHRMAQLVRTVPAFHLEMGPVDEIAPRIRQLIAEVG